MATKKPGDDIIRAALRAQREASILMRAHAAQCVRQFGGRMSTEELAAFIEQAPLPSDRLPSDEKPS